MNTVTIANYFSGLHTWKVIVRSIEGKKATVQVLHRDGDFSGLLRFVNAGDLSDFSEAETLSNGCVVLEK